MKSEVKEAKAVHGYNRGIILKLQKKILTAEQSYYAVPMNASMKMYGVSLICRSIGNG